MAATPSSSPLSWCRVIINIIRGALTTIIYAIVYLPFIFTLLLQSTCQRRGINPADWQSLLQRPYWIAGWLIFAALVITPWLLMATVTPWGLYSLINNSSHNDALPFTIGFYAFVTAFVIMHIGTIIYTSLRPELCIIHTMTRAFRLNFWNIRALLGIASELAQLMAPFVHTSYLFGDIDEPLSQVKQDSLLVTLLFDDVPHYYAITFWLAVVLVLTYALMLGYGIMTDMTPSHWLATVVFSFLPGTIYIGLSSKLYSIFACHLITTPGDIDHPMFVVNADSSQQIRCWHNGDHMVMASFAFVCIFLYSSSANFVGTYRGDAVKSNYDAKYIPRYIVIERAGRGLFAAITTLSTSRLLSQVSAVIIVALLLIACIVMRPCSIPIVARIKAMSLATALWLIAVTLLPWFGASQPSWNKSIIPIIITGWIIGWTVFIGYHTYAWYQRTRRQRYQRAMIHARDNNFTVPILEQASTGLLTHHELIHNHVEKNDDSNDDDMKSSSNILMHANVLVQ